MERGANEKNVTVSKESYNFLDAKNLLGLKKLMNPVQFMLVVKIHTIIKSEIGSYSTIVSNYFFLNNSVTGPTKILPHPHYRNGCEMVAYNEFLFRVEQFLL